MENFIKLYGEEQLNNSAKSLYKAVALYCAAAFVFVAFCATFVALYITVELNVIVCFLLNFVATAAFCWYSVIFFKFRFSSLREDKRFYRSLDNASIAFVRGTFAGIKESNEKNLTLRFETGNGESVFSARAGVNIGFTEGITYDLQTVGSNLVAYREADNG